MEKCENRNLIENMSAEHQLHELVQALLFSTPSQKAERSPHAKSCTRRALEQFSSGLKQLLQSFAGRALFAKAPGHRPSPPSRKQQVSNHLHELLQQRNWLNSAEEEKDYILLNLKILHQLSLYLHLLPHQPKTYKKQSEVIKILNKYYLSKLNYINN